MFGYTLLSLDSTCGSGISMGMLLLSLLRFGLHSLMFLHHVVDRKLFRVHI